MITQTFYKTFLRGLIAILTFSIVFGANIALAQNTYVPPAGPPQSFNAPAPFHTGQAGQAKWWTNLPIWTIGAAFGVFEGAATRWISADDAGVASTQFCLMDPQQGGSGGDTGTGLVTALDYFPYNIQDGIDANLLNCIDWESGWGEDILSSLGTEGNNGQSALDGQIPWWNSDFAEFGPENAWSLSTGVRLLQGNILAFTQAALKIGTASTFEFVSNAGCPNDANGSVIRAKQKIHPIPSLQNLYDGNFIIDCSNGLKLKDLLGDGIEETFVKSIPILSANDNPLGKTGLFNKAKPRPLCYASEDFTAEGTTMVGKGMLIDCEAKTGGSVTIFGGKYVAGGTGTTPQTQPLESSTYYDGLEGTTVSTDKFICVNCGAEEKYTKYVWEVPFGITSVRVKACGGAGGGGGGATSRPHNTPPGAGGGGGGGGYGECTSSQGEVLSVESGDKLVIYVGVGGKGGARGNLKVGEYNEVATRGGNGSGTYILTQEADEQALSSGDSSQTLVSLFGGTGGEPGAYPESTTTTVFGGLGGRSGMTPFQGSDPDPEQFYINYNGQTGARQTSTANSSQMYTLLHYWTNLSPNYAIGGRGGNGLFPENITLPSLLAYGSQYGQGGSGGRDDTGASGLHGNSGQHGNWAIGGGGGGGASGRNYADTCPYPVSGNPKGGCGNDGTDTGEGAWYIRGGWGGHGGPGFVTISW